MKLVIDPVMLNKIYTHWRTIISTPKMGRFVFNYKYVQRNSLNAQLFETWLFEQGGTVFQEHGERFIKFDCVEQYTEFLLKHGA